MFSQLAKDISTGKDGESYSIARILVIAGVLAFIGLSVADFLHSLSFHPQEFGMGLGGLLGGAGLHSLGTQGSEP